MRRRVSAEELREADEEVRRRCCGEELLLAEVELRSERLVIRSSGWEALGARFRCWAMVVFVLWFVWPACQARLWRQRLFL